jgi:hypothetical protein
MRVKMFSHNSSDLWHLPVWELIAADESDFYLQELDANVFYLKACSADL